MTKRKVSSTFKRKFTLEIQERIYPLVKETIETAGPADVKQLGNGRVAYYNEEKNVIVIYDPNAIDKGTVFRPEDGRVYFDERVK